MKKLNNFRASKTFAGMLAAGMLANMAVPSFATPWTTLGPRALGMGGAYTAIAEGPVGSYWNPAGAAQPENPSGFQLPIGVQGEFSGTVLQGANDLHQLKQGSTPPTQAQITDALNKMNQPGAGALVDMGTGLEFKFSKLTIFAHELAVLGATPHVDLVNTTPGALNSNNSSLLMDGAALTEFGVGYGHSIGSGTGLSVGANLKGIIGRVGYYRFDAVHNDSGSGSSFSNLSKNVATSFQPGVDVGALWDVREALPDIWWRPRLGLTGRNINSPKFNQPDAAKNDPYFVGTGNANKFPVQAQWRAGAALTPLHFWSLAADIDLSNNLTPLQGYASRYFSLGTEVNVFNRSWLNIPIRAGLTKNLASSLSSPSWTGGFGLNFLHVVVDVAGSVSSKSTTIQTQSQTKKIPNNVGVGAQLSLLFGGREFDSKAASK